MSDALNMQWLYKNWVHSHEEDSDNEMVFRPSTYKFPPARGRDSMDLKQDGSLILGGSAPDDRKTLKQSDWAIDKDTLILNHSEADSRKMKIKSLTSDKLVIEK